MPYAQNGLPFSGSTSQSQHASHQGAVMAGVTVVLKRDAYIEWLRRVGEATDEDAEVILDMKRSSVCSTRDYFVKRGLVEPCGHTKGRSGALLTRWRVKP